MFRRQRTYESTKLRDTREERRQISFKIFHFSLNGRNYIWSQSHHIELSQWIKHWFLWVLSLFVTLMMVRLVGWLVCCSVGWLVGCSVGWLVGWLLRWIINCLIDISAINWLFYWLIYLLAITRLIDFHAPIQEITIHCNSLWHSLFSQ